MPPRPRRTMVRLYQPDGQPCRDFNLLIRQWLECSIFVLGHQRPAAFDGVRDAYNTAVATARRAGLSVRDANRVAMSDLTTMLFGHDLATELAARLTGETVNPTGFRTTLSQGVAKNVGENFVNVVVYALTDLLAHQDEVLVDKGMPPQLKQALGLKRVVPLKTGAKEIRIPIEGDATIFRRSNPLDAIVISAKTRLKEVFHIGTMWKMLFDCISDPHCLAKWGMSRVTNDDISRVLYTFATADMVAKGGRKTQGPDVERTTPRNLIAMDASFFDYVFVSKTGIAHVENSLTLGTRGALFHEMGCLIELIEQKFGVAMRAEPAVAGATPAEATTSTAEAGMHGDEVTRLLRERLQRQK